MEYLLDIFIVIILSISALASIGLLTTGILVIFYKIKDKYEEKIKKKTKV